MEDKIEMIPEPLMNPDGSVNENCIALLNDTILNMPEPYDRLANDAEWSARKDKWTFKKDITGAFAKNAVHASPYACPDNLETLVKYLDVCLNKFWKKDPMIELSLCDINKMCWDILGDMPQFKAWNERKNGNDAPIQGSSRYSNRPEPDNDFIGLSALLQQVCLDVRNDRRLFEKNSKEFDAKYENLKEDANDR
jgi:hypothetical protein